MIGLNISRHYLDQSDQCKLSRSNYAAALLHDR